MTKKEERNEEKIMFGEIDLECELAGYSSTSSLIEHGVPFYQIKKLVEDGRLVKIERGLYASPDSWEDGFKILQHRYSLHPAQILHDVPQGVQHEEPVERNGQA